MRKLLAALALLAAPALLAGAVEVFGRPLRGLSPVAVSEVAAHPERYRDKPVRVAGEVTEAAGDRVVLSEGGASLTVESDGSFAIPAGLKGARLTAEGRVRAGATSLAATGIEVRR